VSDVLDNLLDTLETELRDFLDSERVRVETERDFLLAVLHGRSDGVTVEDLATDLTQIYAAGYLGEYIQVEDDT